MSRYPASYDLTESRRSPRDQSPGRYNDSRDDFRGGPNRGGERRRSISDARTNQNAFASNRDTFREPVNRETPRDFAAREPPRGPKGVIDAPTGPRSNFRPDGPYRGDFRADRGRGRGRGWREDSRDRGRDGDRDYRDRRDDRAPPFRDDRPRESWGREVYRGGRRASSPQPRGRSPNYSARDTREIPPSLDIHRTRRGSLDGPLSGGSPSSDSVPPFVRGYGRARGGRGRGRGGYHDDPYHRRSRSPENGWTRKTQPSATPPPQVPAFGSAANSIPLGPHISTNALSTTTGPVPGVAVPTAPRSERAFHQGGRAPASMHLIIDNSKKELINKPINQSSPKKLISPRLHSPSRPQQFGTRETSLDLKEPIRDTVEKHEPRSLVTDAPGTESAKVSPIETSMLPEDRVRRPVIGRRPGKVARPPLSDVIGDASDSDSGDDGFNDKYFEDEIAKIKEQIEKVSAENPLTPRPEPLIAVFVRPFMDSAIDAIINVTKSATLEECVPPSPPNPVESNSEVRPEPEILHAQEQAERLQRSSKDERPVAGGLGPPSPVMAESKIEEETAEEMHSMTNGEAPHNHIKPAMDQFDDNEGELSERENLEALEAVRKSMKTPPISGLPKFNTKKWYEDENFLKDLKPKAEVERRIREQLQLITARRMEEMAQARLDWRTNYLNYRRWTDFSEEDIAVRSREKFAESKAKKAAEVASPNRSVLASAGTTAEGSRRTGRRFATDLDFDRVLRESELEAKESKEREERSHRAKTANAKEAEIPDMLWDEEQRLADLYIDTSRLVPFERSFAILEFGEPVDNFTESEAQIFEEEYLEHPKNWGKIAAALEHRDFKACIQHYYLVKHETNLKKKLKALAKKKSRQRTKKNAKPGATLGDSREDTEEQQDGDSERRGGRPRRAAAPVFNFENASESEVASPAPTPARKTATTLKENGGSDAAPPKRKPKVPREKGPKHAKNSQLLAAAPATNRRAESPATPLASVEWKNRQETGGSAAFTPSQFQISAPIQPTTSPFLPTERPNPTMTVNFETPTQPFQTRERLASAPPLGFDNQQERNRNLQQQTSSYWSVPEQDGFPALLRHFGTDWTAIAKHMTSKTHIMVFTTVFQEWLVIPADSNKSRYLANIQAQVKNYYQRQVDSGKMREWEDIAKEANEKRERGESTGPPPPPTIIPKRRYDINPGSIPRSGLGMDVGEDSTTAGPNAVSAQASPTPTQPQSLSSRFPALAQAGPVPQISSPATTSIISKHLPPHAIQQAPTSAPQQTRPPRGPPLGYFPTEPPTRPVMQPSDAVSQRSLMAAQEAQMERQSALKLEQEQREQQQQQQRLFVLQREREQREREREQQIQEQEQALQREQRRREQELALQREKQLSAQRERQFPLKQEAEMSGLHQYEPFNAQVRHVGNAPSSRPEVPKPAPPLQPEPRRIIQQYQPQSHQGGRTLLGESPVSVGGMEIKPSPSPAIHRPPMSAPPIQQEQYSAPPQPAPVTAVRQQETVRKTSSIMSLLNDEPEEPCQPKRVSDVSLTTPASRTPPPQHPLQAPRYSSLGSQASSQGSQLHQQMPPQSAAQPHAQHSYGPPTQHPQHPMHQHSSSLGQQRSYTPTGFEDHSYPPPQSMQSRPHMFSQPPPRQQMSAQPPQVRREPSLGDMHGISGGYSRAPTASQQPVSRLKESPYSATPPPQGLRQSAGSPHDMPGPDREYYQQRSHQQFLAQQQQSAAGSPQPGSSYSTAPPAAAYHGQQQQQHQQQQQPPPQAGHRQLAFGQAQPHAVSPPHQYSNSQSVQRSRHNSFDGRYQMPITSAPPPTQQRFSQAPQHQAAPLSMQYQQPPSGPGPERFDHPYDRERERRSQENARRTHEDQMRRSEMDRRMEDPRR